MLRKVSHVDAKYFDVTHKTFAFPLFMRVNYNVLEYYDSITESFTKSLLENHCDAVLNYLSSSNEIKISN